MTPLIIVAALFLGVFAVIMTPREEEPQIIVPMINVFIQMPGASSKEVEKRVTEPMEKLLWEIPGVEYVYSTSSPGGSMAVVRFYVGQNIEDSIVKVYNKLYSNFDRIPPGANKPIVKPRSIDDVPILAFRFWGKGYDGYQLRQLAAEVDNQITSVKDVSETNIIGGLQRQVKVLLNTPQMAAYGLSPGAIAQSLAAANAQQPAGRMVNDNQSFVLQTGQFISSPENVGNVVVSTANGRPIFLREVAEIEDGPQEPQSYVNIAFGPRIEREGEHKKITGSYPAVTISVAKRTGKNAINIANAVIEKVDSLKGTIIPPGVEYTITRNYGETANEKSNELLLHMMIAIVSVTLLIAFTLGKRESLVVAIAIPVTLALTILMFYLYGYTLNRITLFALIFSIGILVDDAIVVVENIVRHFRMPSNRGKNLVEVTSEAVDEVGNPTILATFAVTAAILPLAFVGGLMGPYMRPIPIGASAAMLFSLLIAFIISPWASYRILRSEATEYEHHSDEQSLEHGEECWTTRVYRKFMNPLIASRSARLRFFGLVAILLFGAFALVPLSELVKVRETVQDLNIYHKNLKPVVYVTGDVAGSQESPVYAILKMNKAISQMKIPQGYQVNYLTAHAPFDTKRAAIKWDGEWQITYEVFGDMGIAFAAVLVLIYILVVAWFKDFKTPLVIMAPIPLTLVGILPAHALLGAFFTATLMIGFIAGAGIIVRNSIILVDFIEFRRRQGMPLEQAVVDAGAVRFRPMLLTAAAVMVGASVILFDPIFQGLAISLMAGEVASTLLSRMAVPVLYYMSKRGTL